MAEFVRLPDVAMVALRLRDGFARGLPIVGKSTVIGTDRIISTGPDEWLAMATDGYAPALLARLSEYDAIAVDVSGNRLCYQMAGAEARWHLSAGCSIDLDRLEPGDARSTLIARAQAIIVVERHDSFLVLPRRSLGNYIETWGASLNS